MDLSLAFRFPSTVSQEEVRAAMMALERHDAGRAPARVRDQTTCNPLAPHTLRDRVEVYLTKAGKPVASSEIATALDARGEHVCRALRHLIDLGRAACVAESADRRYAKRFVALRVAK